MKHVKRLLFVIWSISTFILVLWLALVPMINNESFFQNIWQEEGIYEQIHMSEEELTKVINHTMDYMWDKNDDLQIIVTKDDGTQENFYMNYGFSSDGTEMDELGHMKDCKKLFMGGKRLAIACFITWILSTGSLVIFRKKLNVDSKSINTTYITYGAILGAVLIFGIACLVNFDAMFIGFHKLFFSDTNYSWSYPWYSKMIIMLPEDALFANIVYKALTKFFIIFALIIAASIILQKKVLKRPNQIAINQ